MSKIPPGEDRPSQPVNTRETISQGEKLNFSLPETSTQEEAQQFLAQYGGPKNEQELTTTLEGIQNKFNNAVVNPDNEETRRLLAEQLAESQKKTQQEYREFARVDKLMKAFEAIRRDLIEEARKEAEKTKEQIKILSKILYEKDAASKSTTGESLLAFIKDHQAEIKLSPEEFQSLSSHLPTLEKLAVAVTQNNSATELETAWTKVLHERLADPKTDPKKSKEIDKMAMEIATKEMSTEEETLEPPIEAYANQ